MTKKTIILAVLCALVTLPSAAQYMGPHDFLTAKGAMDMDPAYRAQQNAMLERALTTALTICTGGFLSSCEHKSASASSTNNWQTLVKREEYHIHRNGPLGSSCYAITTPSFKQKPVQPADKEVYQQRFARLQAAISANDVLQHYKLAVPNPHDLVTLGQNASWTFDKLVNWLRDPNSSNQMECSKQVPGVVGISFTKRQQGTRTVEFNLWIDASTQTVYLLNNGKYYGEK